MVLGREDESVVGVHLTPCQDGPLALKDGPFVPVPSLTGVTGVPLFQKTGGFGVVQFPKIPPKKETEDGQDWCPGTLGRWQLDKGHAFARRATGEKGKAALFSPSITTCCTVPKTRPCSAVWVLHASPPVPTLHIGPQAARPSPITHRHHHEALFRWATDSCRGSLQPGQRGDALLLGGHGFIDGHGARKPKGSGLLSQVLEVGDGDMGC